MKKLLTKNFITFIISFSILTSFILCLFNRDLVKQFHSETTKQFNTLKENLQVANEKKFDVDDIYLTKLGFQSSSKSQSSSSSSSYSALLVDTLKSTDGSSSIREQQNNHDYMNTNSNNNVKNGSFEGLVIVSAFTSNQIQEVGPFLKSIYDTLPSSNVVLWDLSGIFSVTNSEVQDDEEPEVLVSLKHLCNASNNNNNNKCCIEKFNFNEYPNHVKYLELKAYRPLIIQTQLKKESGGHCIMYMDIENRLLPEVNKESFNQFISLALNGGRGILGWQQQQTGISVSQSAVPISSYTHPKTFSFFQTYGNIFKEDFYFLKMIDLSNLLVCNTDFTHHIMLRWIECTLTKDCIYPTGAQSTGCRFDKKPLFRYSGCHAYDSSALNVALGQIFGLTQPYISKQLISQKKSCPNNNNDCGNVNQTYT